MTSTTKENVDRVHYIVRDEWRLTVNQITNGIKVSRESVENIMHNELSMTKASAQWMSRLFA